MTYAGDGEMCPCHEQRLVSSSLLWVFIGGSVEAILARLDFFSAFGPPRVQRQI